LLYCQLPIKQIKASFPRLEKEIFTALGESRESLIQRFGSTRDLWITTDPEGWRLNHLFYPGIVNALKCALKRGYELYILSTKQTRFTAHLLNSAEIPIPCTHISGLENGRTKDDLLFDLLPRMSGDVWYFIEDRPEALLQAAQRPDLKSVQYLLAAWGYNFPAERNKMEKHPAIKVITLPRFISLCTT